MKFSLLRKWPLSLSVKFALAITLIVAGVAFTIGGVMVVQDWRRFHADLEDKVLLLARSVAVTAPEAILRNDYWSLYRSLKKLTEPETGDIRATRIVTAMVLDPDGFSKRRPPPGRQLFLAVAGSVPGGIWKA